MAERMAQDAPYPTILADLVTQLRLDPGWRAWLSEETRDTGSPEQGHGLTLSIRTMSFDTYHSDRGRHYAVLHTFAVPPATYNRASWLRWLFNRYVDVLTHEGMEFFRLVEDDEVDYRPYAPNHGPGHDPYVVREETSDLDRRTQFTGGVDHK